MFKTVLQRFRLSDILKNVLGKRLSKRFLIIIFYSLGGINHETLQILRSAAVLSTVGFTGFLLAACSNSSGVLLRQVKKSTSM